MFDNRAHREGWEEITRANEQRRAGNHDLPLFRSWFRTRVLGRGALSFRK
jgi:hypothetical protein